MARRRRQVATDIGKPTKTVANMETSDIQLVSSSSDECVMTDPVPVEQPRKTDGSQAFWQRVVHDIEHLPAHAESESEGVES